MTSRKPSKTATYRPTDCNRFCNRPGTIPDTEGSRRLRQITENKHFTFLAVPDLLRRFLVRRRPYSEVYLQRVKHLPRAVEMPVQTTTSVGPADAILVALTGMYTAKEYL